MLTPILESAFDCLWMAGIVMVTIVAIWVMGT
jgi:hypothetical protein